MDVPGIIATPGVSALARAIVGAASSIVATLIANSMEGKRAEER